MTSRRQRPPRSSFRPARFGRSAARCFGACGEFKLWEGDAASPGLSQQLTDWYSFTHVIHGVLFYFLLWLAAPGLSVGQRFMIALALEVGWEILEEYALRHPPLPQAAAGAELRRRQHRQFACRYAGR